MPMLVPRSCRRTRITTVDNLESRIRRAAGKILVGENIDSARMIHRQQLHLVEVDCFFERFHETETKLAVFLANRIARHLYVFRGPRNVALVWPNPVTDHARAQHVSNQLVVLAVPGEKCRTGTAAAIHFKKTVLLQARDLNLVLYDSGRPEHAHHVGFPGLTQRDNEVRRVLSQIAGRSRNLELLAIRPSENLDFGADRTLVVRQALERKPQPIVLVSALIAQKNSRAVILSDKQIGGAVAVVVAGDDRSRIFQLNFVETHIGRNVFESIRTKIAEETDFAFAISGFTYRD